jgi:pimeloyl-ACP methyl ester carboxylesterase
MSADTRKMVRANGVDLCVETFGDQADPAILLIGGAAGSMDYWDDRFCQRLADGGRFVIRYDFRDTGQSVNYPAGRPGYTLGDLIDDALGILDTFGLVSAHIVGISMGGNIAMQIAVRHPDRVASLTLLSTSSGGPNRADLPSPTPAIRAYFDSPPPEPDWTDREATINYMIEGEIAFAGDAPLDLEATRALAGRVYDRTRDVAASQTNHWILDGPDLDRSRLTDIRVPTLILHGTDDPLFPFGHGEALANELPGAKLVALPRTGHQMPPPHVWDIAVPAILEVSTSPAREKN